MVKHQKALAFTLTLSLALFAALAVANAQGTATVAFLTSIGGTTDPTGTQTYADGTSVQITATVTDTGYVFTNFIILSGSTTTSTTDNPATLTVKGGETYAVQAVFNPIQGPPGGSLPSAADMANAAIVVILPAVGGTTTPKAGTYALANAVQMNIAANPSSGWTFSHWVITGSNMTGTAGHDPLNLEPTDNPYNVNHGYGATFYYQAVFTQTNAPSPSIPEIPAAMIAVLTVALVASVVASVVYRRRK
jgi:hypothetical protein